jgi:ABC-type transporter Mla MlaB component
MMNCKSFFLNCFVDQTDPVNVVTIATEPFETPLVVNTNYATASLKDGNKIHSWGRQLFPRKNFLTAERLAIMPSTSRKLVSERLCWQGALIQSMSMDLGGEILNALKDCDILTVNLDAVELLDYSCLVILCAVKRQANEKGKVLILEGLENPAVAPLLERYRNNGSRLCRAYCGQSCLFEAEI